MSNPKELLRDKVNRKYESGKLLAAGEGEKTRGSQKNSTKRQMPKSKCYSSSPEISSISRERMSVGSGLSLGIAQKSNTPRLAESKTASHRQGNIRHGAGSTLSETK
jgi:hypothetical protein